MPSLIGELRRRNVFKVAVTYAIVAWLLIQVASIFLPTFDAPRWVLQTVTFVIVLGFPAAIALAWAYELTPEGVRPASATSAGAAPAEGRPVRRFDRLLSAAVLGLLVLALALLITSNDVVRARRTPVDASTEAPTYTAAIVLPQSLRLGTAGGLDASSASSPSGRFALSPDGRQLAIVATDSGGQQTLWLRPLESDIMQPLAGTEGAEFPFWSPNSRSIAFIAQGKLKRLDLAGGAPITLAEATIGATGAWSRDDVILYTPAGGSPINRVSAQGGTPMPATTLATAAGDVQHWYPSFLPDGRHFLYFAVGSVDNATHPRAVMLGSLETPAGPDKLLVEGGSNAKYASGHLLFARNGTLIAQAFDSGTLELVGEPIPVVEHVQIAGLGTTGVTGAFTVSENGMLAYQTGTVFHSRLVWFDRSGAQLAALGDHADYGDVTLSPDGTRAAVSVMDARVGTRDLWIFDIARGIRDRQTFDPADDFAPVWSEDGQQLVFSSRRADGIDLYRKRVGTGTEETLFADSLGKFVVDWSADGRYIVYIAGGGIIARSDLWILPLARGERAYPFAESTFVETHGQFSPDGRWLAYTSSETGRREVYVAPFPGPGARRQISTTGGGWPRWGRDGREIFYLASDNALVAAAIDASSGALAVVGEERLFTAQPRPFARLDAYPYDVAPDGQRFIVNVTVDAPVSVPMTLVVNWPRLTRR
jgi:Tol biopolymer transport system component